MAAQSNIPPGHVGSIILVDGEEELVSSLAAALRAKFGEDKVNATCDPGQALEWIHLEKPRLLIANDGPNLPGFEIASTAKETWGPTPTIVLASTPSDEARRKARQSAFRYLAKPISPRALLEIIEQFEGSAPASFSGAITISTLTDLLQLYAMSSSTGMLQVRSGERKGGVWFERGQITHANSGDVVGFDAFCEILRWPAGSFSWRSRRTESRTITMSAHELMMEALRIQDEQAFTNPPSSFPPASRSLEPLEASPITEELPPKSVSTCPPTQPAQGEPARALPTPDAAQGALALLSSLEGFVGASLVDSETDTILSMLGGGLLDIEMASFGNSEMLKAKYRLTRDLAQGDEIEDILITLGEQYHLIRPLRSRPGGFFYLAVDRQRTSLATARFALAEAERGIK